MTRTDRARDTRKPPVRIVAGGEQTPYPLSALAARRHDPSLCRAARNPPVAFVSNPGPPTGGASFAVLARG